MSNAEKPREWTISKGPTKYLQDKECLIWEGHVDTDHEVHYVIEKSHYDAVVKDLETVHFAYDKLSDKADALAAQLAEAKKDLEERTSDCTHVHKVEDETIALLEAQLAEAKAYPTVDAYESACKALNAKTERIERLERALEFAKTALEPSFNDVSLKEIERLERGGG